MASIQNKKQKLLLFSTSNEIIRGQQLESLVMPCKLFMQRYYPTIQFLLDTYKSLIRSEHFIECDDIVILSGYILTTIVINCNSSCLRDITLNRIE